jgi:hypothetical protein
MQPITDPKERRNKLIGLISGAVGFALVSILVNHLLFKSPSVDKMMMQAASEMNKSCPIMVDRETRLDNGIALPGKIFQYNYTLVNLTKAQVSTDTLKKYMVPQITKNVSTNPGLKMFRDVKATMAYYYKDKNGEFVFSFSVTPDEYASVTK